MNQVPLSITDSHRRALSFHSSTSAAGEFALAIDRADDPFTALQIHQELQTLIDTYTVLRTKALDRANAVTWRT